MGRYRTIVADPPWPQLHGGGRSRSMKGEWAAGPGYVSDIPYSPLTVDEIKCVPVDELAEANAHLYLWTTNQFLESAYAVARAWGFRPSILLTWCKTPRGIGFGGAFTISTEFVLFCRRGSLRPLRRLDSTWWQWPRGAHSAKPEAFIDLVEQVSPPPYVELFARRHRLGWDVHGFESANTAQWGAG